MLVANFGAKRGGEWASSRRNLGRLFVCTKHKSRDLAEWSGHSTDRDQRRACGASDDLIMDWQPADIFLHTPDFGHGRA